MRSLVGETLGHYQIVTPLGSGGTGDVYRATDLRLMRDVALKVLREGADAGAVAWLQKEARVASSLNHPNIVTIHDVGTKDATPYIAMEFVRGVTLRESLSAGLPPLDRLLRVGEQIANGLAKAHEAGIVHRDLKPENLMLSEDGLVKILDFGLAKSVNAWSSANCECSTPKSESPLVGTVAYMSPESVQGRPMDYRSDQFTLGIILYEMAAGVRPFQRPTPVQTLTAIIQEAHEPLCRLNANLPIRFSMLVDRCLSKSPAGRYTSTRELAHELKAIQDDEARTASSKPKPVVAVLPFADISPDGSCRYFCEGIAEEIHGRLQAVTAVTLLSRFAIPAMAIASIKHIAAETRADALVGGSVRLCRGRVRIAAVLTEIVSGHSLWSRQYDRRFHDILGIQADVARRVVTGLLSVLLTEQKEGGAK